MEEIVFESQIIEFSKKHLKVEMRMFNNQKNQLKALAWMTFVHLDLKTKTTTKHSNSLMKLFNEVFLPLKEKGFDEREQNIRLMIKTL